MSNVTTFRILSIGFFIQPKLYLEYFDIILQVVAGNMKRFVEKIIRYSRVGGYAAAGVVAVVGVLIYERNRRNPVYSSWTTNYDPSVKWDFNWDRYLLGFMCSWLS